MNETTTGKQPLLFEKISLIDERIEKLASLLSPILNQNNAKDCVENLPISKSLIIERLDATREKLDALMSCIDIN